MDASIESWKREERHPFTGWDFSHLDGRMIEGEPPWSYTTRAGELMCASTSVLDIDTGGGERLLGLRKHWPPRVVATEAHPPNVALARSLLEPEGATLVDVPWNRTPMPFADGEFDLILSRHSPFQPGEVARMLSPGGTFLTQQVRPMWAHDLLAVFGARPPWPQETLHRNVSRIEGAGLAIVTAEEWSGELAFTDVGAVVYYLRAVPWLVPGFSVDTHLGSLYELQRRLDAGDRLAFEARKYYLEARRPPVSDVGPDRRRGSPLSRRGAGAGGCA